MAWPVNTRLISMLLPFSEFFSRYRSVKFNYRTTPTTGSTDFPGRFIECYRRTQTQKGTGLSAHPPEVIYSVLLQRRIPLAREAVSIPAQALL